MIQIEGNRSLWSSYRGLGAMNRGGIGQLDGLAKPNGTPQCPDETRNKFHTSLWARAMFLIQPTFYIGGEKAR